LLDKKSVGRNTVCYDTLIGWLHNLRVVFS